MTLKEAIEERHITQRMVAVACGVNESLISNIIAGREGISAKLAIRLEAPLGITAEFWAKLQALYEVGKERGEWRPPGSKRASA
jgi:HTH-type transcriptional regulator/antitoxin HigA